MSSSVSTVSVSGSCDWPGTLVSPSACWTFSGRAVSLLSSKPDSWQPSSAVARDTSRIRAAAGRARTACITSDRAGGCTVRPHRSGQDRRRPGARPPAARARRGPDRDLGGRPSGLPRPRDAHGRRDRARAGRARAPAALVRRPARDLLGGRVRRARPRRDRRGARGGAAPDRRRRHRPLPPGRPDRPGAAPAARTRRSARPSRPGSTSSAPSGSTPSWPRGRPPRAAAIDPRDRTRVGRALELLEMGEDPAPGGADSRLWTAELRHPTLLCGLTMERAALYERIDARVDAMIAAGAADEVARVDAAGAGRHGARGARLRGAARRRPRGHEAPHAQLREAPARLDAPPPGRPPDRPDRSRTRRRPPPRSPVYCRRP